MRSSCGGRTGGLSADTRRLLEIDLFQRGVGLCPMVRFPLPDVGLTEQEIEPHSRERGYRRFHRQEINDFYVRVCDPGEDLVLDGFRVPP